MSDAKAEFRRKSNACVGIRKNMFGKNVRCNWCSVQVDRLYVMYRPVLYSTDWCESKDLVDTSFRMVVATPPAPPAMIIIFMFIKSKFTDIYNILTTKSIFVCNVLNY